MSDKARVAEALREFFKPLDSRTSQPPDIPPPPPMDAGIFIFLVALIFGFLIILLLIRKAKSKGAGIGAIWGLIGLIMYVALMALEVKVKILLWAVTIIALPSVIWSEIAYQLGGGGSFYYNPGIALLLSIGIGALIGYVAEKIYMKIK